MLPKRKSLKNRNILVTGGQGFIGKALVERLNYRGSSIVVLDAKNNFDVRNYKKLSAVKNLQNIECLYHLAALSFVPYSWENPWQIYEVNILGTLNILEFCRCRKIKKIVYVSSYIYGKPRYLPVDERHPIVPANPYAWSKYIAENLCIAYANNFDIKCIILRPFNIYGYNQNRHFLIPSIIEQIKNTGVVILNDPKPKRDFIFIDDMVEALVAAGDYEPDLVEIFNIGYGRSYSITDIMHILDSILKKKIKVQFRNQQRKDEIFNVVADINKACKKLKWKPRVDLIDGLRRILQQEKIILE